LRGMFLIDPQHKPFGTSIKQNPQRSWGLNDKETPEAGPLKAGKLRG